MKFARISTEYFTPAGSGGVGHKRREVFNNGCNVFQQTTPLAKFSNENEFYLVFDLLFDKTL